jgi:pimeloyl-ACP methyl ester carboxylesterase
MESMQEPILNHLAVPGPTARGGQPRQMAFWDWSSRDGESGRVVVCVHGLSRQGRDFDVLARALSERARVIAVDVAGRGHSDWLDDPMGYQVPTYAADLAALLMHLRAENAAVVIDWVGTSMGGLIGMALAARAELAPRRLVLNDVGPAIQWEALLRIGTYLGANPSFDSEAAAIHYLASISAGFGPHTPEQWRALSLPLLRERDGRWWLHYDPAIALPVKALVGMSDQAQARQVARDGEALLWTLYDAITSPTLLLRGGQSDLLSAATAREMTQRGPKARCVVFDGVGHAPTLVSDDQVAAVRDFLWSDGVAASEK